MFRIWRVLAFSFLFLPVVGEVGASAKEFSSKLYTLEVETVADGLDQPWGLAWLPDGRMLVTEKGGRLRVVSNDGKLGDPVKGVPKVSPSGQGGLLDVLVDPDFENSSRIYFSFSEPGKGGAGTSVARATFRDNRLSDVKIIFRQTPKTRSGYHFGSRLVLRKDGSLFITLGDRGERDKAQDTRVNRGQVVRVNVDGTVPKDNPFADGEGGRAEIWSYGHRNVQGAALHPETDELWTVEHGARGGDELNKPEAGRNYGWPVISYGRHYSGFKIGVGTKKKGMEQPEHYWDPSIAPSGLAIYSGNKFPKWKGSFLVGALKFRLVSRLEVKDGKVVEVERLFEGLGKRIRDVRQGPDGAVYLLTDADPGQILRITPK